jgi:hypothetical protein
VGQGTASGSAGFRRPGCRPARSDHREDPSWAGTGPGLRPTNDLGPRPARLPSSAAPTRARFVRVAAPQLRP